jgi:cobalt/nickel transport system ATP-binding protein
VSRLGGTGCALGAEADARRHARRRRIDQLAGFRHTKVIASHDLDLVWCLCRRTLVLDRGAIAADGPTEAVLSDRELLSSSRLELPPRLQGCPNCGKGPDPHPNR